MLVEEEGAVEDPAKEEAGAEEGLAGAPQIILGTPLKPQSHLHSKETRPV